MRSISDSLALFPCLAVVLTAFLGVRADWTRGANSLLTGLAIRYRDQRNFLSSYTDHNPRRLFT